jgi:hypothetical protein
MALYFFLGVKEVSMLLGFLLGVLLSLIMFTIALGTSSDIPFLQIAQSAGSIAIAISAVVALNLYLTTVKRHRAEDRNNASKEYLNEAINLIERAYEVFTDKGQNVSPPRNDRLLWFTTARMIVRYNNVKDKITENSHLDIVQEHEEYWRIQFYELLENNNTSFTVEYFQPSGDKYHHSTISRKTIPVIFNFSRWHDETQDVLEQIDEVELLANGAVSLSFFGVEDFIEQYEEFNGKVETRKRELSKNSLQAVKQGSKKSWFLLLRRLF